MGSTPRLLPNCDNLFKSFCSQIYTINGFETVEIKIASAFPALVLERLRNSRLPRASSSARLFARMKTFMSKMPENKNFVTKLALLLQTLVFATQAFQIWQVFHGQNACFILSISSFAWHDISYSVVLSKFFLKIYFDIKAAYLRGFSCSDSNCSKIDFSAEEDGCAIQTCESRWTATVSWWAWRLETAPY